MKKFLNTGSLKYCAAFNSPIQLEQIYIILTVMSNAMKPYFLISIFLLSTLFSPMAVFTEEKMAESHQIEGDNFTDDLPNLLDLDPNQKIDSLPLKHDFDHEFHTTWPDHHPQEETDSFESKFFNMIMILGLLIGFMFLASRSLKRMMKSKMTHMNSGSSIKVLETRYLSPRATLYLIEIQDQSFLIAESPTSVTYLKAFPFQREESPPVFPIPKKFQ